jgi:hypothetical protein
MFFVACLMVAGQAASADTETFQTAYQNACVERGIVKAQAAGHEIDAKFQKSLNATCTCSAQRLSGQLTPDEMKNLTGAKPDPALIDRIRPIVHQCRKENFAK